MEEWRDIKGYEGLYQVSSLGRVKSLCGYDNRKRNKIKEKVLKNILQKQGKGYYFVTLWRGGEKAKRASVHRLVANAFLENQDNKPCVNHIDGNTKNNRADNLEWCTYKENTEHAYNNGFFKESGKQKIVIVLDKEDNKEYKFRSQRKASAFMGHGECYIAKRKEEKRSQENEKYKWWWD